MLYRTLLRTTLVTISQVRRHIRAQKDSKILISHFTCRDRREEVIGGLISGRNLRGVRELLFKFAMPAIAVTPRQHVIRITMTIIPPASSRV